MKKILLFIPIFLISLSVWAQAPKNDNCDGATLIPNLTNFCSKFGDPNFSNAGATPSGFGTANCFSKATNDVWYSFVPLKTDINIVVKGQNPTAGTGGSMKFVEAALYSGDCNGQLTEWECASDNTGNGIVNLYQGGLLVGQTYFLRVQARSVGKDGTFQVCIENYNPPKAPEGDCPKGSILCDKSPFVVQSVSGFGQDGKEIKAIDGECFSNGLGGGQNIEMSSTWYRWTCEKSGTLEFTLTPLKDDDDIDFILFELPGGIDDCPNKTGVRCMACGDSKFPSPCMGPTGLRAGESDISESSGCGSGKNSFIKPLDMVAGKSYALMVNNFTSTSTGFKMDFGGTGTFVGPVAKFKTSTTKKVCYGAALTYQDESSYPLGQIVKWQWNFGQGSNPGQLTDKTTPPLHSVVYNTPGVKYVSLTVESSKGCLVTAIDSFEVESCCKTVNKIDVTPAITNLKCPDLLEGTIDLNPKTILPTSYKWDFGATTKNITGLGAGFYTVTISNTALCDTVLKYEVKSPVPLTTDTLLKKPTCNGGQDGIITLLPKGGKAPYEYDFGSGFSNNNTLNNLPIGKYPTFIKDANGCLKAITVDLKELELTLDPTIKAINPPACFGFDNGSIVLNVSNGKQPFKYDFGTGFQNTNSIDKLKAGTYNVVIQDANLCKGIFKFEVMQPDKLVLQTDTVVISCYGANDGKALVSGVGGTGAYKYSWSDAKNQSSDEAKNLSPAIYTVTVTDENGCSETVQVGLENPPKLDIKTLNLKDVLCFNDRTGELQFVGVGGRPPYQYSLDGVVFQKADLFKDLAAGNYSLTVRDSAGCEYQLPVTLRQPSPFVVDAGDDKTIELGELTNLNATTSPADNIVKTWLWIPSDSTLTCKDCPNPIATPYKTTTYTIKAVDETGCQAIDRVTIVVIKNRNVFFPNIFSPGNDDGVNDRYTGFSGRAVRKINLIRIFDRWGNLIFEKENFATNDLNLGWDGMYRGQKAGEGIYTFYSNVEFIDGEVITYKGDFMLMR